MQQRLGNGQEKPQWLREDNWEVFLADGIFFLILRSREKEGYRF
jgi:hypothetical protein